MVSWATRLVLLSALLLPSVARAQGVDSTFRNLGSSVLVPGQCVQAGPGPTFYLQTTGAACSASVPIPPVLTGATTGYTLQSTAFTSAQSIGFLMPIAVNYPSSFSALNWFARCDVNPSETDLYTLTCGGSTLGTISLNTSCSPTYATTTPSYAASAGQHCEIVAPGTVSGTVRFAWQLTRQ